MNAVLRKLPYLPHFADGVLCPFLRRRLKLPALDVHRLFPDFDDRPITIQRLPRGAWSTPLADVAMLLKFVVCARPKRILEIGSFRGYTTLLMAEHAPESRIVAVDLNPDHGEAYRGTKAGERIERRVGAVSPQIFASDPPGSYDLAFIDADHRFRGVKTDTELVLPLIARDGFVFWHDYANWGYFDRTNGVPEYLNGLGRRLGIARIPGTALAVHSPRWSSPSDAAFLGLLSADAADGWQSTGFRG
mgnify:CR=1 FL=1